jgi:hypothetical protein
MKKLVSFGKVSASRRPMKKSAIYKSLFEHCFKGLIFEPLFGSWDLDQHLDRHKGEKSDPDPDSHPHQIKIWIRISIK